MASAEPRLFLAAGVLAQSYWNYRYGYALERGLSDIDIVYFDADHLGAEQEAVIEQRLARQLASPVPRLDVKNQARVHLWFEDRFGYAVAPHTGLDDAVRHWPTTSTAIALSVRDGDIRLCAPYGLQDLADGIVRPNPLRVRRDVYEAKCARWLGHWPELRILPWPD